MSTVRNILRIIEPHPGEHFKDKIIAVCLAFVVWFAVSAEDSYPRLFQDIPVSPVNLPPDLALAEPVRDTLTIRVQGPERDVERVTPGLVSPQIDLSGATAGENFYQINAEDLNLPAGVSLISVDPPEIRVNVEPREEKYVPVSPVTAGEPAPGFEVVGRATSPQAALISGPRSAVAAMQRIETATVDVSGRRESFTQMVTLVPRGNPLIELPRQRTVELRIDIVEQPVNEQFDGIQVEVINNRYQVQVNPAQLGVVLSGPPSLLDQIDPEQMRLVIDAAELEPAVEDYRIEPTVRFEQTELGERVQVVALYPQRVIDVRVFQQPARQ